MNPSTRLGMPTTAAFPRLSDDPVDAQWQMWRDTPDFSQCFHAQLDLDTQTIPGRWEKSTDRGATWEHDFNIDHIRERA